VLGRSSRVLPALAATAGVAAGAAALLRPRSGVLAPVPVRAGAYFTEDQLRRARAFGRPQLALFVARSLAEAGVLAGVVRAASTAGRGHRRRRRVPAAALAGAGTSVALQVATLPLTAVARRRAMRVGLTTDPWRAWAVDQAKATVIGAGIAAGGAATAVALMRRAGDAWWLPASGVAVAAAAGSLYVGPLLIDPLFNTYTVLPAGRARSDVLDLARRADLRVGEIYTVDASRRTTAANAYVTGLGPTKRVVLYDTLLEHFDDDETRLVIAHELAHVRHRDVLRSLAFLAAVAPVALLAVARLTARLAPGGDAAPVAAVVPALALAASVVGGPVGVIARRLSRRVEARADTFALEATGAPEAWISFERRIALRNLADPDPPAWLRMLLGTHPSVVERIGIAEAYASEAITGRRPGPRP
jgi:STE24 endopeptidase